MDEQSKRRLRVEAANLIDQCETLEAHARVTREAMKSTLELLKGDSTARASACAYELIRLATACQMSAVRFDYELIKI